MGEELAEGFAPGTPIQGEKTEETTPMKRYGAPEEIAPMMPFLPSVESQYSTGGVSINDGGM